MRGSSLTIRKFRRDPFTMADLIKFGTLTHKSGQFLEACVRGKLNILISGGTGSGKTTTLNVLSAAIPSDERIITVEDAAELQLKQDHVITLESRPANIEGKGQVTIRDLVRNTLRMRPDRIIVGECRGPEAVDMLQAMNTGHDGSLTTVHANNPRDALARTETLVLTAGVELPLRAIREQISSAFDLIVQVSRLVDGTRRITHVTEVLRMESDVIALQDIFIAKPVEDGAQNLDAGHRLLGSPDLHRPQAALPGQDGLERRQPAAELLPGRDGRALRGAHLRPGGRAVMRRRSLRTLALVAVAALTVAAPAAASAPALVVKNVNTSAWPEVTVTAQTPDPSTTPELKVIENGQAAANVRLASGADKTAVALAIDTSESMHGPKMADAIAAATTFVTGAQSSDSLGVFAFDSKPYLSVAFPANSTGAASGLAALATGDQPGTAIYGGVKMAAQALSAQPIKRRAIVLLTDGSSDHDSATESQADAAAKAAHATIYSVGIQGSTSGQAALRTLASSTGGQFLQATNRTALVAAYAKISAALSSTFTFTYHSLVPKGTPIHLALSVPGYGSAHGVRRGARQGRGCVGLGLAAPAHADERRRPGRGRRGRRRARALRRAHAALRQARSRRRQAHRRLHRAEEAGDRAAGREPGQDQHAAPAVRRHREDRRLVQLLEADGVPARAGGSAAAHGRGRLHPDGCSARSWACSAGSRSA